MDFLANQPDFGRMTVPGGSSPYRQPVLPGEQRLVPVMQEKLQPALPEARRAAADFLNEYLDVVQTLAQLGAI